MKKKITFLTLVVPPAARRSALLLAALAIAVAPNLVWIWLDKTVWPWDPAWYGKHSVDLFVTLLHAPSEWWQAMMDALGRQAPGIAWAGQFFVPIGLWIGSIDTGLLLSIVCAQAVAVALTTVAVWDLSGRRRNAAATALVVMSSAPLLVGMSHYYFVEMMQTAAVAWFVLIMARAPSWSRMLTFGQLTLATWVAMLAKVSSPLFCFAPGLVALYYLVTRPRRAPVRRRLAPSVTLALAILIGVATVAWYLHNGKAVVGHVSLSSRGPVAELYGESEQILPSLGFWLSAVAANFFSPYTMAVAGLTVAGAIAAAVLTRDVGPKRLLIACAVSGVQIAAALLAFSLSPNRATRYLLPVLPYVVVLLGWAVSLLNRRIVTVAVIAAFTLQWAHVHAQALQLLPKAESGWLNPANRMRAHQRTLDALVRRTCPGPDATARASAVGVQLPWMNAPAASYAASKVAAPNRVTCEYDAVAYYESDADAAWTRLASRRLAYFIGMDGDYAVPDTAIHRTLNQLNGPILKRVETSELFRPEPGIPEDLRVRVFRRIDRVADGRALSDRGRHEEAIAELTRATALDPTDVEAWATLALAHERHGSLDKAIAAGLEARRLSPGHYYVNLGLARAHARREEWTDARARAQDAADRAPGAAEHASAIALAARSSFAAGDAEGGCTLLRRALAVKANSEIQDALATRGCAR